MIWNDFKKSIEAGKVGVLATIIQVEGSAYQKEGTKCFITEEGVLLGLLSGGCVEGDIIEHAKEVWDERCAKTIRYDFRGDEDDLWGMGVGCNGAITIFLEPYDPSLFPQRAKAIEMSLLRPIHKTQAAVTVIKCPESRMIGERWVEGTPAKDISEGLMKKLKAAASSGAKGLYSLQEGGVSWQFFIDYLEPIPRLLMIGAGPDAVPVVKGAKELGWYVTVLDHRPAFLKHEGFLCADEWMHTPPTHHPELAIDENTFIVIMSHHFAQDQLMLHSVITSEAPYIGVLGPRHRTEKLLGSLTVSEEELSVEKLKRIHSPIGLDIGAKTPAEIAISILAQLTACYRNRQDKKVETREVIQKCLPA